MTPYLATAGGIAFFYSMTTGFYNPFLFTLFVLATTLFAAWIVRSLRSVLKERKFAWIPLAVLMLAASVSLPILCWGTPAGYRDALRDVEEYLSETYPQQKFTEKKVYYHFSEKCYLAELTYLYDGNPLTSTLLLSDPVEDGFLTDFVSWMQEKRKSVLIDVLKNGTEDVLVNSSGLSEKTSDGVFHGSYGQLGTEMEPLFHFSATFRQEKPDRRDFADACRSVMATMKEHGFDYGSITFYALDAGNVIYECTVSPKTDPEQVLSLVKYAR